MLTSLSLCVTLAGDENLSHVPHREHQRREQAEGRWEAGGEAVQQVWRPQRQPAAPRRPAATARLRPEDREDEGEGGNALLSFWVWLCWRLQKYFNLIDRVCSLKQGAALWWTLFLYIKRVRIQKEDPGSGFSDTLCFSSISKYFHWVVLGTAAYHWHSMTDQAGTGTTNYWHPHVKGVPLQNGAGQATKVLLFSRRPTTRTMSLSRRRLSVFQCLSIIKVALKVIILR